MSIRFEAVTREASLLSPLRNFEPVTQTIEHRRDPLTGRSVIVLGKRMDYVKRFIESDEFQVEDLASSTQTECPFCAESLRSKAPKFGAEISTEGRIQVGEAVCFPSLFAHEDFNAIVVPTRSHKLPLNEMPPTMFVDAFKACIQYFDRVHTMTPAAKYDAVAMNFYPPAGSTVAHPHIQALASDLPFRATTELLGASESYFHRNGSSYWTELIHTEERLRDRHLGKTGKVHWLTPFAPMGLNEVDAIVSGISSLDRLADENLSGLSEGLARVLRFYYDTGVRSFNFAVYSGPYGEGYDYFDLGLRIVSRYGYKSRFVSDVWALQYLLGDQEVYEAPEETCTKLRRYFE
jgi:UDPglucose--hexose-1-phosphate uridylyltransferase